MTLVKEGHAVLYDENAVRAISRASEFLIRLSTFSGHPSRHLSKSRRAFGILHNPAIPGLLKADPGLVDYIAITPDMFWTDYGPDSGDRFVELESWTNAGANCPAGQETNPDAAWRFQAGSRRDVWSAFHYLRPLGRAGQATPPMRRVRCPTTFLAEKRRRLWRT